MAKPDVRVRLSAEGVAEVVSALKKIQTEGQKASAKSKRGFMGLNNALGATRNLIGGLGIVLGVATFKRLIGGAIEAADQINKLGAKVGATTEHLSALQLIARTADADLNQVGSALIRMNKNIGDAAAGIPTAVGFLRDLGLDLKDFEGKDSVETFALISEELMGLEDQLVRNRVAIGLFGRSGAQLMPTMKALADEGLGAVIARAEELGVLIDHDLAAASEQIKDDVEILKMQSEAIGIRFISGFGPELSQTLQTISGDLKTTTSAWHDFGQGIGKTLKWVVALVSGAFDLVGTILGAGVAGIVSYGKTMTMALRGNFAGAKREMETYKRYISSEYKDIRDRMEGRFELIISEPPKAAEDAGTGAGVVGGAEGEMADLAARRAQALATSLDRELALAKSKAALRTKAEQREFAIGLQSYTEYYTDRMAILEAGYAEELAALEQKRGLLDDFTDPARRLQEEKKIDTQLATVRLNNENAVAELLVEERETIKGLAGERIALEQEILQMQGQRIAAERLGFEERIAQADLMLRKQGATDEEREATLARLRAGLEAGSAFEEAKENAEAAMTELGAARQEIEAKARAGMIGELDAETQLLGIEEQRLERLRELAELLEAAALATGDPEKIEQARAFSASILEIGYAVEASSSSLQQFKATAIDSTTSALADFFETGIGGAKGLKASFRDMALAVIGDLKRLAAQMLASQTMKWLGGFFSGGGQVDAAFIGPMPAGASGGLIRGPGTGTSDSIRAWLSDEEFITRAAVVRQPGVLEHLRALNRYGARTLGTDVTAVRFAEGGLVGGGSLADSGSGLDGRLTLGLEDGLVLRDLESREGQRVTIESIRKNRRAVRSALGI